MELRFKKLFNKSYDSEYQARILNSAKEWDFNLMDPEDDELYQMKTNSEDFRIAWNWDSELQQGCWGMEAYSIAEVYSVDFMESLFNQIEDDWLCRARLGLIED